MSQAKRVDRRSKEARDLRIARWTVGVLCGLMLVGLTIELRDGAVGWATDPIGGRPSSASQRGHHTSSSPKGFGHPAIWGPAVLLTLVGFAGLTVLSR